MRFQPLPLAGAFEVELQPARDARGHFMRRFDADLFRAHGLPGAFVQCSVSFNTARGTLRGLHYQAPPALEAKVVRCLRGASFHAIVDLRNGSPTYARWHGTRLDPAQHRLLFVPEGFAHGFLTLEDGTEIDYEISRSFEADAARGVRFDDPRIGIEWPGEVVVMSERDRALPLLGDTRL